MLQNADKHMQSKSSNSTTTVLLALLLIFTFPIWIGIAGGIFGIIAGVFGAVIGIFAGVFGAIFGIIGGLFGWIFDWHPFTPFSHWPIFTILAIALVVVLISRSRKI